MHSFELSPKITGSVWAMKGRLALCIQAMNRSHRLQRVAVPLMNIHITNEVGHIHRVRALIDIAQVLRPE